MRNSRSSGSDAGSAGGNSGGTAEDYGQGWTQLTDHGKIYLSRKEKNVFILEGTKAAGFSACAYNGNAEQKSFVENRAFTLTVELKTSPGDHCHDQQVFLLLDTVSTSELTSGCDFCAVRLGFDSRELRVESQRRNQMVNILYAQPNCALLRPNSYVTLAATVNDDSLTLSMNGVSLVMNLRIGNRAATHDGPTTIGLAVYGKTRSYVKRFRISAAAPETPSRSQEGGNSQIVPHGSAPSESQQRRGSSASARTTSYASINNADKSPGGPHGYIGGGAGNGGASQFAGEEMELASTIERDIVCADLHVRFEDIGGLADAKRAINEAVTLPLLMPEFFTGIRKPWKGVLLFGPPGTGKTMLAKAVASCTENITFFNCSSATLTSKWRGESEKLLRALFMSARARVPSILFFDEIDSLLSHRGSTAEHEASRRFKSEFLIHMDGLLSDAPREDGASGHMLVLATSNAPWDLDEALRRRLEKRIYIPLPDMEARLKMFEFFLRDLTLGPDVEIPELASRTEGYSGADVQMVCRDASMNPMRRAIDGLSPVEMVRLRDEGKLNPGSMPVTASDFESALQGVQPSVCALDTKRYEAWAKEFGSK